MKSREDLIGRRLAEYGGEATGFLKGLAAAIKTPTSTFMIGLPEYDFLRAEVFAEDLMEIRRRFVNVERITALLFQDFIDHVRAGADLKELMEGLQDRLHLIAKDIKRQQLERVALNHWKNQERTATIRQRKVRLDVTVKRREALRAEVLLHDMHQLDPTFELTVEGLIAILILDLVHQLKAGQVKYWTEAILSHME